MDYATLRRLVKRKTQTTDVKEGAHGGTRGFPVLGPPSPSPSYETALGPFRHIRVKRQKWAGAEPALFMRRRFRIAADGG